jgi:subtilisin family serine protease
MMEEPNVQTRRDFLRLSAVISVVSLVVSLHAVIGSSPAAAQVLTVPGASGQLPPCEVGTAAVDKAAAFPCGIIVYAPAKSIPTGELSSMVRAAGARVRFEYTVISGVAAVAPNRSTLRALHLLHATLIPDRHVTAIQRPPGKGGGGGSSSQVLPKGVERIGAPDAWTTATGSGVGVAIVDTGLDLGNADLLVGSLCFDAFGGNCQDQHGHGTHVGGTVAARNNTIDVVGVAPDATVYAVKVLNDNGSGTDSTVMAGLDWISSNSSKANPNIRVANMSLGRPGSADDNPALHNAVVAVRDNGVTIVVAAGNDPNKEITDMVPAAYPEVLAVASTTAVDGSNACNRFNGVIQADTASYFTTDGTGVAVSGPGEDQENLNRGCLISSVGILSLKTGGGTTRMSGTSMAAPHVAGVAALLVQTGIAAPNDVRSRIACSAERIGTAPLNSPTSSYSFDGVREGIVSAAEAVTGTCK